MFLYAEKSPLLSLLQTIGTDLAIVLNFAEFGHHVRLATDVNFSTFVKSAGIDFYPFGGDPRILAGFLPCNYRYGHGQWFNSICTRESN
ncbi:Sterol 3-beta-glucosyltransferase UGT80B1 [Camellia lanceoleosa]|uniref:Sterol 3-beta-glucosyltransferase UGT80B1 n=1 Tax=Camellia lanceoleosa TaxID=1840588 RepID=A0ACC0G8S5_9ERIC|nr:Sterol 3-beta-glucosyltransferase UGT80B1 [Camellia lanceoleosa]